MFPTVRPAEVTGNGSGIQKGERMSMNLTKCSNGHFYDGDAYASCPYCGGGSASANKTVAYQEDPVTQGGGLKDTIDLDSFMGQSGPADVVEPDDDPKTIGISWSNKMESPDMSPIVGWLVCTKGKFYGQDFRLKSGRNFIGRGADMDVCLAGENTVSRSRHAIIIHEPRKNIFLAQPGDSRGLFYVNGDVVLSSVQLKKNDVLQIGDVQLMLIPCCDEAFQWSEED